MNGITKVLLACVAITLISYVGVARTANAATLEQVTALMTAFSTMKFRVLTSRRIAFWDAQSTQTAHCWLFYVPNNVPTPPKGQGFYAHQWAMTETSAVITEEQCYA